MTVQQAVAVSAFDHSVVPVMDLWRAERFYTEVLDGAIFQKLGQTFRPPDVPEAFVRPVGAFVKLGRSHFGLFLEQQTAVQAPAALAEGAPCWALAVAEEDFPAVVARVRAAGVPVTPERTERYGGVELRGVRCTDSEGNCLELVADPRGRYNDRGVTGLSHMHVEALDVAATADFYGRFLGLEVVDQDAERAVLGLANGQFWIVHRVAALSRASIGPHYGRHFAFHVTDEAFHGIVARLRAAGIEEGDALARHVPGELASYFYDPNGLWLQILNEDSTKAVGGRELLRYARV
jgi:catechol 2,3-dioxygenase-like lactoylglutathione lyase family enzyme